MERLKQDVVYALRQMSRNPGFTLAVVLMLSLGIGANTATFSVASRILRSSLPFEDSSRLMHIRYGNPSLETEAVVFSVPELKDYQAQTQAFSGQLMEFHSMSFVLLGRGEPDRVQVGVVSANAFQVLGVRPLLGRTFRPDDEASGAPPVLVLSYEYWRSRMNGDPKIIGQTMRMNDQPITVVGILPVLPKYPEAVDVYMPTSACPFRSNPQLAASRDVRMVSMYGRLRPGASLAQAKADISTIEGRLHKQYPANYPDSKELVKIAPIQEELIGKFRPTMLVLLCMVALVLLLTCANVGILYSVRLLSREREIVLRSALGAGRGRIIRQLLTEGILLSLFGGLVGLGFAALGIKPLGFYAQRFTPLAEGISINGKVLLFTLLLSLMTGLLFGLIPAFQVSRHNLVAALKEGGGRSTLSAGRHRFRSLLILVQVAVSFVLLITAGLAIRSSMKLSDVDPGVQVRNVLSLSLNLPFNRYQDAGKLGAFYRACFEGIGALPGVVSVGAASTVPLTGGEYTPTFTIENRETPPGQPAPRADMRTANRTYFQTVGIPLLRGRTFLESDNNKAPLVAVITASLVNRYWANEDPIGKKILFSGFTKYTTIIGVVADTRQNGLDAAPSDAVYYALRQAGGTDMKIFIRTQRDPTSLVPAIRRVIHSLDAEQPIEEVQTLEDVRSKALAPMRVTAALLALFAGVAFTIMVIGISWAIAFGVTERRQELAVRSVLGAQRGDVLGLVLKQGLVLVVTGLVLGAAVALAAGRILSGILFGIEPTDPATFVLVALAILLVAGIACLLPARRAANIEPSLVLRG